MVVYENMTLVYVVLCGYLLHVQGDGAYAGGKEGPPLVLGMVTIRVARSHEENYKILDKIPPPKMADKG